MERVGAQRASGRETTAAGRGRRDLRLAGAAGVAGPVLFTATFVALERVRASEFDAVAQPVSALEAGPYGWVQQISFVVFGVLTLVFAAGLHRGLRPRRRGVVGPAVIGASGAALLLAAAIPLREDAAGVVYDPGGHVIAGTGFFAASALGLVIVSRRIAADPAWAGLARWTLAAGLACGVAFLMIRFAAVPADAPLRDWLGLLQRATILLAVFPARIALSLRLLRVGRGTSVR